MNSILPTEQDAADILFQALGKRANDVSRFTTGSEHFVFDVKTESDENFVVRMAKGDNENAFLQTVFWHTTFRNLGIPVPEIYYFSTDTSDRFPSLIMERLAGVDLGDVYPELSKEQRFSIVREIVRIQNLVHTLPMGKGFGYGSSVDDISLKDSWRKVILGHLARSRQRIGEVGVFSENVVDQVEKLLERFDSYIFSVKPVCFLDDTTTKNVIVYEGKLSGIVDLDAVCFGDPLYTVALTRMSLLSRGWETDYTDFWVELLGISVEQQRVLDFYTLVFCVDFMAEVGHAFNKEQAEEVTAEKFSHFNRLFEKLVIIVS